MVFRAAEGSALLHYRAIKTALMMVILKSSGADPSPSRFEFALVESVACSAQDGPS